jgi:hypothetical protein
MIRTAGVVRNGLLLLLFAFGFHLADVVISPYEHDRLAAQRVKEIS